MTLWIEPRTVSQPPSPTRHRIDSIDLLRGLVMVLMVLDHVRDFMGHLTAPETMENPGAALFLTRWVTHFCAPVFVLLAGVGAFFHGERKTRSQLAIFLLTRGVWLVALEVTVIYIGWMFAWPLVGMVFLQVIWVIGISMLILAGLIWLPRPLILAIALPIILGHDALSRLDVDVQLTAAGFAPMLTYADLGWSLCHVGFKFFPTGSTGYPLFFVIYPLIPWCAVMAAGYAMAPMLADPTTRVRNSVRLGTVLTLAFVVSRFAWPTLDLNAPFEGKGWIDFISTNKYPPSLPFLLMTIGPAFLALAFFEKCRGRLSDWLLVFGRVPLFFYIAHIYLAHALSIAWVRIETGAWHVRLMDPAPSPLPALSSLYVVWFLVVAILYPVCRWFMHLKQRRRDLRWLAYL